MQIPIDQNRDTHTMNRISMALKYLTSLSPAKFIIVSQCAKGFLEKTTIIGVILTGNP